MLLIDVNVLVFAHRADAENHHAYRAWLESTLQSEERIGLSDLVLAAVVRIVSHSRIYRQPTPLDLALRYVESLREDAAIFQVSPGPLHWGIFTNLCRAADIRGSLVSDAYFAALAIENGAEWITADRDYARFPGLRWRHPLAKP
ncbi:MAG: type II toxin-antitoxin system VapC family toxin [Candidatus Acidiferrales bacterium]